MRLVKLVCAVAAMAMAAGSASAATIVGFGSPASNPALAGATVVDFTGLTSGNFITRTVGDLAISGTNGGFVSLGGFANQYNSSGQALHNNSGGTSSITFSFAETISAFAFNMGAHDFTWTLRAYAGDTLLETLSIAPIGGSNAGQYYGATGAGITRAVLNANPGDYIIVDNVSFLPGAVPEPAAWALMISGFGLAGATLRRRRRLAAA